MNTFLVVGPDSHAVQSVCQTLHGLGVLPQDIHQMKGLPTPQHSKTDDGKVGVDPHINQVLVYNTPAEHLQQELQGAAEITPQLVEQNLEQWTSAMEALLAQYYANSPRCLLVHSGRVVHQPRLLSDSMCQQWGMQFPSASTALRSLSAPKLPGVPQFLLKQMINGFPATGAMLQELEATAHVPSCVDDQPEATVYQLWAEHIGAPQQAQLQATQASEQFTQIQSQVVQAQTQGDQRLAGLADAYESLLLQLDEAQQAMEHYFLLNQNATEQLHKVQQVANFWQRNAPVAITVNLCNEIDGSNWYHAEEDGRWAGPGLVSTLQMPPMPAGRYAIELAIQGAMQPEIVVGMQLSIGVSGVGGVQSVDLVHDFSQDGGLYPMVSKGAFDLAEQHHPWVLQLSLPGNQCPAEAGGNDTRRLGIKLQALRLNRQ